MVHKLQNFCSAINPHPQSKSSLRQLLLGKIEKIKAKANGEYEIYPCCSKRIGFRTVM
jgi:hypothetical protein